MHKTTKRVVAKDDGVLVARIDGFVGDWNLFALRRGIPVSSSDAVQGPTVWGVESVRVGVRRGWAVDLVACNASSAQRRLTMRYASEPRDDYPHSRPGRGFDHLSPGKTANLRERVPVQVVFLGLERDDIDVPAFVRRLPDRYRPIVRARRWYGLKEYVGLDYSFDHSLHFTPRGYEDRFFAFLRKRGKAGEPTRYQARYNDQLRNVRRIDRNLTIDATSVERWLAEHPPPGVDTTKNTVVLINWYGRKDFRFHVYSKVGERDPDTGYRFGVNDAQRVIAWGGTPPDDPETGWGGKVRRVWFYDISAGPDAWTVNWNVDDPDVDGDGVADERIPPVWEYHRRGFKRTKDLTGDLADLVRYVAIDTMVVASPLFPPALAPPLLPSRIDIDINTYETWPGVDASRRFVDRRIVAARVAALLPLHDVRADEQEFTPDARVAACYGAWLFTEQTTPGCYPDRPYSSWANLFVDAGMRWDEVRDDRGSYEIGAFNYPLADDALLYQLGFADDNWRDATPSFVFAFVSPIYADFIGFTTTLIHELGHHVGLNHPHSGFDYEEDRHFNAADGRFWFVWSADERNSVMGYLHVNWDFSQFDRDNVARWQTATYVTQANAIARMILDDRDARKVRAELHAADDGIGRAKRHLAKHRYLDAAKAAKGAHTTLVRAARRLGIRPNASTRGTDVDAMPVGSLWPTDLVAKETDLAERRDLLDAVLRRG